VSVVYLFMDASMRTRLYIYMRNLMRTSLRLRLQLTDGLRLRIGAGR
jgi:hypothetical protein